MIEFSALPGVWVDDVDSTRAGEVHVLFGEKARKST